jgi:CheY-like chemotaxis protein
VAKTVLVVEDNPFVRELVEATLRGLDLRVVSVADGLAALVAAARHRPDLVVLDVNLPGLLGFDVCARLRADPATHHAVVAFLTARGAPDDEARGLAVGGDAYFVKPFSPAALRRFVAERLGVG